MSINTALVETIGAAFGAGDVRTWALSGGAFELLDTPGGPVEVVLSDRTGAQVARMTSAEGGHFITGQPFEQITIQSASAQTVRFMAGGAAAGSRRTTGAVSITGGKMPAGALVNSAHTVTTTAANAKAAASTRDYLLIQNKSATGRVWVAFGATATQALGVLIGPGGSFEPAKVPTAAVSIVGDLASNPDVVIVESV